MNPKDQIIEWLSDAYAMERALVDTLKKHASDAEDYPDVRQPIENHIEVTEDHAEQVKALLESLDADTSVLKTGVARFSGLMSGLPTSVASDTLVKNALAEFAAEHFEIACYTSLAAAAAELGLENVVAVCEGILADEEEMAALLETAIPEITVTYLGELAAA